MQGPPKFVYFGLAGLVAVVLLLMVLGSGDDAPEDATAGADDYDYPADGSEEGVADNSKVPQLDRSTVGEFRTLRPTALMSSPGNVRYTLTIAHKVYVQGTADGQLAYVTDESGNEGYVRWSDINANPFDTNEYNLVFSNSGSETRYFFMTYRVEGRWYWVRFTLAPFERNYVFAMNGRTVEIDTLEAYYFQVTNGQNLNRVSWHSTREVYYDNEVRLMTPLIPEISGSQARITF